MDAKIIKCGSEIGFEIKNTATAFVLIMLTLNFVQKKYQDFSVEVISVCNPINGNFKQQESVIPAKFSYFCRD